MGQCKWNTKSSKYLPNANQNIRYSRDEHADFMAQFEGDSESTFLASTS
jgi:hypothetical protein